MKRTQPDLPSVENFITTWQTGSSVQEIANKLGLSNLQARHKASKLRESGVELQKFRSGPITREDLPVFTATEAEKKGYVTAEEASKLIGVTPATISGIAASGKLKEVGQLPRDRGGTQRRLYRKWEVLDYRKFHKRVGWGVTSKTPKNGLFFKAMLVGAPSSLARRLRDYYSNHGIAILWHYKYDSIHLSLDKPIPSDCELVIIGKDMVSHGAAGLWKDRVKQANIMGHDIGMIRAQCRKKSSMTAILRTHGYLLDYKVNLDDAGALVKMRTPRADSEDLLDLDDTGALPKVSEPRVNDSEIERTADLDPGVQQILDATAPTKPADGTKSYRVQPLVEGHWSISQVGALSDLFCFASKIGEYAKAAKVKAVFIDIPKDEIHVEYE